MFRLKSLGVMSVGKMMAIVQGAIGLIFLPFFFIASLAGAFAGRGEGAIAAGVMLVLAVMIPVLYAAFGFVMGILMAVIYNAVASKIGGVELELAPMESPGSFNPVPPVAQ